MNDYRSICDTCVQSTWYDTVQPCKGTITKGCPTCGSHEYKSTTIPCPGTLRLIDYSDLLDKFTPYYTNRQRIEVTTPYGETIRGYVGKTNGWKPIYMLLPNANSNSSSTLLDDRYEVVKALPRYR